MVVGDLLLDRYWYGATRRISPEAPVPVVLVDGIEERVGGAANVAANAAALEAEVLLVGIAGEDAAGERLKALCREAAVEPIFAARAGHETAAISRIVNAFFAWEFNSAEMLVAGNEVYPIDYANACPDVALTSLHYYFPWAIKALVRWSVYCLVTGRKGTVDLHTERYFEIADDASNVHPRNSLTTTPNATTCPDGPDSAATTLQHRQHRQHRHRS